MVTKPSVLIVDRSSESREVLRTALERRGVTILEANRADRGLQLAEQHHPDVIVLDLELQSEGDEKVCGQFAQQAKNEQSSLVVLGTAQLQQNASQQCVSKPYHYGPLIRKIESLIN